MFHTMSNLCMILQDTFPSGEESKGQAEEFKDSFESYGHEEESKVKFVYKKLKLEGTHKSDDDYFESISKDKFESLEDPYSYSIELLSQIGSSTGCKLGGIHLYLSDESEFKKGKQLDHTKVDEDDYGVGLDDFGVGTIRVIKEKGSERLVGWKFKNSSPYSEITGDPVESMFKDKGKGLKVTVDRYVTLKEN